MMKSVYLLGIGGSGAKCVRAALHLHAIGAYGDDVKLGVLLVDADASNGNLQTTRVTIENIINAGSVMRDTNVRFFNGQVKNYGFWNPLAEYADRLTLSDIYREKSMRDADRGLGELFDALISTDEKQADLSVGFRGRPSIGSAVVSRIRTSAFSEGPWPSLIQDIDSDCQNGLNPRIHFFGSIFGGTGSSGLPTLGTLLSRELSSLRSSISINASVLLPYFDFDIPSDEDIYAEANSFTLNTDAALQYLARLAGESFNCIYLVGDSTKQRYEASTGGPSQNNPSNVIEMIAAAAVDADTGTGYGNGAYLTVASEDGSISWDDLPGEHTTITIQAAIKTCFAWYSNLYNELRCAQQAASKRSFTKGAPWFDRFFAVSKSSTKPDIESREESAKIGLFDKWCVDFLEWAQEVCWSGTQRQQLANLRDYKFAHSSGIEPMQERPSVESLSDLLVASSLSKAEKWKESSDLVKNDLADYRHRLEGVIGLVNHFNEVV